MWESVKCTKGLWSVEIIEVTYVMNIYKYFLQNETILKSCILQIP